MTRPAVEPTIELPAELPENVRGFADQVVEECRIIRGLLAEQLLNDHREITRSGTKGTAALPRFLLDSGSDYADADLVSTFADYLEGESAAKSADQDLQNDQSVNADADMLILFEDTAARRFQVFAYFVATANNGVRASIDVTGGDPTLLAYNVKLWSSAGMVDNNIAYGGAGGTKASNKGATAYVAEISGFITPVVNNILAFTWAQFTSHADNLTLKKGSCLSVVEL